jgi:hypothetical protein
MLKLLLHISEIIKDVNDVKAVVEKLVAGSEKYPSVVDGELILSDLVQLIDEGVIVINGLEPEKIKAILSGIQDGLKAISK